MPDVPTMCAPAAALRSDSRECCMTPGSEATGRGSLSPSLTNIGSTRSAGCSRVSLTSRRRAWLVLKRRGLSTGKGIAPPLSEPQGGGTLHFGSTALLGGHSCQSIPQLDSVLRQSLHEVWYRGIFWLHVHTQAELHRGLGG